MAISYDCHSMKGLEIRRWCGLLIQIFDIDYDVEMTSGRYGWPLPEDAKKLLWKLRSPGQYPQWM